MERVIGRVLTKPLGRIQRAAGKRTDAELAEALSKPPSKAPVWALRALAVGEAAKDGDAAVVAAAFQAVHGDQKKLRRSFTQSTGGKRRQGRKRSAGPQQG